MPRSPTTAARTTTRALPTVLLVAALLAACGPGDTDGTVLPSSRTPDNAVQGVLPTPGLDPVVPDPLPPGEPTLLEPPGIQGVVADTVRGWTGPGGRPFEVTLRTQGAAAHLHQQIGRETFPLAARTEGLTLTQYPCTACHQGAQASGELPVDGHPDMQAVHPAGAECSTCHILEAVERLTVPRGESVTLDHAYQLCAQCHFPQSDAWAAGIHGKRLEGWSGRRVVMNCADCHNPHAPSVAPRTPYPGPRFP